MSDEVGAGILEQAAKVKIATGYELIEELQDYQAIEGVQRLQRKIQQDVKFMEKALKNQTLKRNHLQCSNLVQFDFLVRILKHQRDVVQVDCSFPVKDRKNPLRVDIVCENGLLWLKAIARNSKGLVDAVEGAASFGVKSILDQADDYVKAAQQHLCMFQSPKIVFYFSHKVENQIVDALKDMGIKSASLEEIVEIGKSLQPAEMSILNLDITTMLAYVSAITNGGANYTFREKILTEQAEMERQTPLKPILDQLFSNKRLICCATAHQAYKSILDTLAGSSELERSEQLMQRIEILPDVNEIPVEFAAIKYSGKINERSLNIFAFGVKIKAITVTSNKAFVRSAKMQGINIPVFTHQARALTEAKQVHVQL